MESQQTPRLLAQDRIFLWKIIHDGHRIGGWWKNIPGYEQRAQCETCGTEEDMSHILTTCTAPGQQEVWNLVKDTWEKKQVKWTKPTIGDILSCGLITIKRNNARRPGAERLYRILISEAAHLIWKLRCERIIDRENDHNRWHTKEQIETRWRNIINSRLTVDRARTHPRLKKSAIRKDTVLSTWSGTLQDEEDLPDDWITSPRVLVSSSKPGRNEVDPG